MGDAVPFPQRLDGFAFAGSRAFDRADALRADAAALRGLWPDARLLVLDGEGRAAADAEGMMLDLGGARLGGGPGASTFLGLSAGQAWFALEAATLSGVDVPRWIDLRSAAAQWPADLASLFAYARGMLYWHARNRYCGVCGGNVAFDRAGFLGHCAKCGNDHYPRVDPAVIVAVSDGERLLLGRQPGWPPRRWSVVAGFVEPGETLEQTVVREVREETGVRVHAHTARYLASQPWPFPGSLMLGFIAEAEADTPVANDELEDARWFRDTELVAAIGAGQVQLPQPISISRCLIEDWLVEQLGLSVLDSLHAQD